MLANSLLQQFPDYIIIAQNNATKGAILAPMFARFAPITTRLESYLPLLIVSLFVSLSWI